MQDERCSSLTYTVNIHLEKENLILLFQAINTDEADLQQISTTGAAWYLCDLLTILRTYLVGKRQIQQTCFYSSHLQKLEHSRILSKYISTIAACAFFPLM